MPAVERITSVLGPGVIWHGDISGSGGVRIEGAFEGQIALKGLLVIGETGRVTCDNVRASSVIVAGAIRGNITTEKLEIRASGRVWGDVTTIAFVTDEGAFLRGQIRMEETVDLGIETPSLKAEPEEPAPTTQVLDLDAQAEPGSDGQPPPVTPVKKRRKRRQRQEERTPSA
jgi:cytoskeletal protein CcmA (bactofilin family)